MGNKFFQPIQINDSGIEKLQRARQMRLQRIEASKERRAKSIDPGEIKRETEYLIGQGELDESVREGLSNMDSDTTLAALREKASKAKAVEKEEGGILSRLFSRKSDPNKMAEATSDADMTADAESRKTDGVFDWARKRGEKGYAEQQDFADKGMKKFTSAAENAGYKFDENGNILKLNKEKSKYDLFARRGDSEVMTDDEKKLLKSTNGKLDSSRKKDKETLDQMAAERGRNVFKDDSGYRPIGKSGKKYSGLEKSLNGEEIYSPDSQDKADYAAEDDRIARKDAMRDVDAKRADLNSAGELYRRAMNEYVNPQPAYAAISEYLDNNMAPGPEKDLKKAQVLRYFRDQRLTQGTGITDRGEGEGRTNTNQNPGPRRSGVKQYKTDDFGNHFEYVGNAHDDFISALDGNKDAQQRYIKQYLLSIGISRNHKDFKALYAEAEGKFKDGSAAESDGALAKFRTGWTEKPTGKETSDTEKASYKKQWNNMDDDERAAYDNSFDKFVARASLGATKEP